MKTMAIIKERRNADDSIGSMFPCSKRFMSKDTQFMNIVFKNIFMANP